MVFNGIWHVLTRRKILDTVSIQETQLSKCLNTGDLTALGVGSTLGIGIYVLGGHVARDIAGPSVVVSFLLAALASVFAGLCYAEFGSRVPRAGSAYIYSYVCVGEFIAFIIGWNLILEYVIGSASVSRGVSLYLDSILNNTLKETFKEIVPVTLSNASDYFDLFAFGLSVIVGVSLAFGLKYSSIVNNVFTVLNICVVIFIIGGGAFHVSIDNWFISESNITDPNRGTGGFYPYGFAGTLKGAATCFFGFVGFDCIATTGEEVKNPKKSIPLSIVLSLAIVFLSYFGVSAILTLMTPYYDLHEDSPIPYAFASHGWVWAKWIIAIGGIFGMLSSLFGAMYPLPRILYAMASDGLIFSFLGIVSSKYKSPIIGTIIASLLTGTMAGLLELQHLVNMMSIGTLMAYTIVAACIVLLRYKYKNCNVNDTDESRSLLAGDDSDGENKVDYDNINSLSTKGEIDNEEYEEDILMTNAIIGKVENLESTNLIGRKFSYSFGDILKQLINCDRYSSPTNLSSVIVSALTTLYCLFSLACGLCIKFMWDDLGNGDVTSIVVTSIFGGLMLITLMFTSLQPRSSYVLSFKVPLVPLIPFISIFFNIYLMLMLDPYTWIRFGIWMAIGIPVYVISLWIYGRGTNYITYAQKSSINGSLNYGIDNIGQCKEMTFNNDSESIELEISNNDMIYNKKEDQNENLDIENQNFTLYDGQERFTIENNSSVELNDTTRTDSTVVNTDTYNFEPTTDYGEEIELLDKVLEEAEEATNNSLCDYVDPTDSTDVTETQSVSVFVISEKINDIEGEAVNQNFDVNANQSVIALVHREDEQNPPEEKNNEITISETSILPETNVTTIEVSGEDASVVQDVKNLEENQPPVIKTTIPVPPPFNESNFNSLKPFVKNKSPKIDRSNDKVHLKPINKVDIKNDENSNVDEDNLNIKQKLDHILSRQLTLQRGMSIDPKYNIGANDYKKMHKSETDLQAMIKKEADVATLTSVDNNESRNDKTNPKTLNPSVGNNNNSQNDVKSQPDVSVDEDKPPTKDDIKKKLESLFARSPAPNRAKLTKSVTDDEYESDDTLKPKNKHDYTNTMKIRFGDVLKSLESNSRRGSTVDEAVPRVNSLAKMQSKSVSSDNVT